MRTQSRGQASPATGGPEGATRKGGKVEINRQLFFTTLGSLFLDSWMKWSALIFPRQKEALRSTEHTRLRLSDLISSCCSHKLSHTLCCLIVQIIYIHTYNVLKGPVRWLCILCLAGKPSLHLEVTCREL